MSTFKILFFILFFTVSCQEKTKHEKSEFSSVSLVEKEYDFGRITLTDTIYHTFKIKNVSKTPLKITEVGTSCGCTTSDYTADNVSLNEEALIKVMYVPKKGINKVKESIVVECNVEFGFATFYLTGEVVD